LKHLPHPSFAKWFQRTFLRAWIVIALFFIAALIPSHLVSKGFSIAMAFSFASALIGTLAYLFYQLFHVKCPQCNQPMETTRGASAYTALCHRCDTTWDLGIGVGGSD